MPTAQQIRALEDTVKRLEKTVKDLEKKLQMHKHMDTDGTAALDGTRVKSLIFQPQGNGRRPKVDGEFFYNNGQGVQNFRLQMIDRNTNPPTPRNWTIDLSAL